MSVLILAEQKKGTLVKASLGAVTAGKQIADNLGSGYDVLLIGPGAKDAAPAIAKTGAGKVLVADSDALNNYMDEAYGDVLTEVAANGGYTVVVGLATTTGKAILPRLAAKLEAGMASEVTEIVDAANYIRPVYAGNLNAQVEITTDKKVLSVRGTSFDPIAEAGEAAIEDVAVNVGSYNKEFIKMDEVVSDRPPLTEAAVVVSGGRGLKAPENYKIVEELADLLGGAVGATRATVDAGWIENDYQVGQTGKVVAPDLYIAVGLSGAIQHLAGMKDSKVIVAINKDEEAPIFSVADYGLVADLFEAVPQLVEKIKAAKG